MKKCFLTLCVLIVLSVCFSVSAEKGSVCAINGEEDFSTLQEAFDKYSSGVIVMMADAANVTVNGDVTLNLNGHTISGITVTGGTLFCMDSETDDYSVADGLYGTIKNVAGKVMAADGYLPVADENGLSFHCVGLQISAVSLRPSAVGMYYSCNFSGDEKVADATIRYGVALNLSGEPTAEKMGLYSAFSQFPAGETSSGTNSILLKEIMKPENTEEKNSANGSTQIYARAYIQTNQGYWFGNSVAMDLQTLTERIDTQWSQLSEAQQNAMITMYEIYKTAVSNWSVPNLVKAATPDVPATMTKQSYNGLNYWLYTPANPTKNMPLIVYLHGGSGKGDDLDLVTGVDGFPQYIKEGRISCRAYIVFPQCPSSQKGWKTMGSKIESLVKYTCSTYRLNRSKVSLTGHSMGGTGTWSLALDYPDLFYKIAPMSGSVTMNGNNLEILSSVPIWAFVGDKDTIVSPDTSVAMINALRSSGANARLTILEGADHFDVPALGYLESNVVNWLIS